MKYSYEELEKCRLTRDMLLKWFWESYNENEGDVWDKDNIDFKVIINGKELENPFTRLEKINQFINQKVDEHCKTLENLEDEIEKIVKIKVDEKVKDILEDKVCELQNKLNSWIEELNE